MNRASTANSQTVAVRVGKVVIAGLAVVAGATALAGCSRDEISGTGSADIVCDVDRPGGTVPSSPTSTGETIPAYAIDVEVEPDGSATFTETITYSFIGSKHGIYRELIVRQACTDSEDRVYPLEIISVRSDTAPADYSVDQPSPPGLNASDVVNVMVNGSPIRRLRIGDPDRTITGTHTYEIVYRLDGVVNTPTPEGQTDLYWNVIGDGWGVDIFAITSSVRAPEAVTSAECWAGPVGSTTPCTSAQVVDGTAQFTQESLGPRQALTVRAAFPATAGAPLFDDRWSLAGALWSAPWIPLLALVLTILAILGWLLLAHRVGRDRQAVGLPVDVAFASEAGQVSRVPLWGGRGTVIPVEYVPPSGIRPGQVGLLVDETADTEDITATIVDLAVRGHLRIDESETKSGWLGSEVDYTITRLSPEHPKPLLGYEQLLLDKLVPNPGSSRSLSSLKDTFADDYAEVVDALYDDAMQRGWFHDRPDHVRTRWRAHGVLFLLTGIAAFVACFLFTRFALLTIPIMVWGLLTIIGAGRMPRRTAEGRGATLRARGFETFIRDSEAPRAQWAENNNIFSDYLPYAIVLGCADRWAKTFSFLGDEARGDTDWYHGAHHGFTAGSIVSSMSDFSSSASSSLTSSPSSSGGGGGGGSSGGGGGGGGGGSW